MKIAVTTVVIVLVACAPLGAQTRQAAKVPTGRIFVSVNGGYQVASNDFTDSATFPENAENRQFSTEYSVKAGPAFNVSGGAIVSRHFAVGLGVTRFSRSTPTTLSGSTPHPFFFNRPRSISGAPGGVTREELAVHVQLRGVLPLNSHFQAMVFGGPSFFRVKQGMVSDFQYAASYPYDVATFSGATTNAAQVSKVGFNVGGDVECFFTRQLGVGFGLQYAATTVEVLSASGGNLDLKVGGLQAGLGLRLRF